MRGHPLFMTFFFFLKTLKPPDPFYCVTLKRKVTLYRKKQTNQYMAGSRVRHTGVKTGTYYRKNRPTKTWREAQSLTQRNEDRKEGIKTGRNQPKTWQEA